MEHRTLSGLAREAGLADSTARRYVEQFAELFPCKREGRRKLYAADGAETLKLIAELYSQGLTAPEVGSRLLDPEESTLATTESPVTLADHERMRERLTQALETLGQALQTLADQKGQLREQGEQIATLTERIELLEERRLPWWERLLGSKGKRERLLDRLKGSRQK